MSEVYDIVIVGSGFAGSIFAMIARRLGRSVVLIERGRHPRVVIGESSTPLSNLLLEDLATRYDLPALNPLAKWGSWQRSYPELACGLKRGFSFFHHDLERPQAIDTENDQMLVAASPHDEIADTHWYRSDVDAFLVREAQKLGVEFIDEVKMDACDEGEDEVRLSGSKHGERLRFRARFVVDATGPRGFLHAALGLSEAALPGYPGTGALYSHFSGVGPLDAEASTGSPYPVDDAAVHHVFDGGWIWVLRFNNGITSAGVAATDACAERLGLADGEGAWTRLLERIPALANQFADAVREQPFTYVPRLSFRSSAVTGARWALLPSAAGFVDPLLSTGFPLTLLGVSRLTEIVERSWGGEDFSQQLTAYATATDEELLATSRLIAALYASMARFTVFRSVALLYFAAASFSETARRLGKPDLASSFLLHNRAGFGRECRSVLKRLTEEPSTGEVDAIVRKIETTIEPIDVAGLCRRPRDGCYPVLADDLFESAWKLGATTKDVGAMLDRAGFFAA